MKNRKQLKMQVCIKKKNERFAELITKTINAI